MPGTKHTVVLCNDSEHTFDYVFECIKSAAEEAGCSIPAFRIIKQVLQVHKQGSSVIIDTTDSLMLARVLKFLLAKGLKAKIE